MGERAADGVLTPSAVDLLDALPQAVLTVDRAGTVLHANASARRLRARGMPDPTGDDLSRSLFPSSSYGAFEEVLSLVLGGRSWSGELDVAQPDGGPVPTAVSVHPVREDGQVTGALVLVLDRATEASEASAVAERLTRLARVAAELVAADSVETVTRIVIEHMADATGATVASLSLLVDDDTLRLVGLRGGRDGVANRWATYSVHDATPAGDAVRDGRPVLLNGEREITSRYPALERAAEGARSIACLPLRVGVRRVGVVSMSYPGSRMISSAELEFLTVLADFCAQAIERVRATGAAADRAAKLQFLADASVELSSSLDYEATLAKVARLAVPWFADWCTIALDQDGELRTLAVAHVDPAKVALAEELQHRYPPDPGSSRGGYQVLRSGRSELTPDITEEMLNTIITDPEQRRLLRELNLRSAMSVPLKVHGRVLGVVTWVAGDQGRRFDQADLQFGEDLAHRAALAIDTAQLHTELSEVATRLQRAILPADLPKVPGWLMAASYLQAGHSDAGGDFYDVTPLGAGRIAVFVGDVMGRGVTAAAAMAQMRAAIRALVAVEPDPRTVLLALDRLFEQYDFQQLVTMIYAVADPVRGEIVVANAGHPPPVVRRADGSVEVVSAEPGLLLGAGGGERKPVTVPFDDGDLFLAYTDGLVERRDEDIDAGVARLASACAAADEAGDLFKWLADVVLAARDTRRDDDVAVLAVRRASD